MTVSDVTMGPRLTCEQMTAHYCVRTASAAGRQLLWRGSNMTNMRSQPEYAISDRVTDEKKLPESSPMRVVDPYVGIASETTADDTPISEFEGNEAFPEDDPVVEAVFEEDLDRRVVDWDQRLGEDFDSELTAYENEWGVDVRTFFFTQSGPTEIPDEGSEGDHADE